MASPASSRFEPERLERALHQSSDVLLGRCAEERGQQQAAVDYYHRVFVVDIQFRDVGGRLTALEGARR